MLETVMKHGIIFYVIGILMAAGVLSKLISYITARKLVRAASDIQKSNQKLMRLVKAKFEHASMVSDKVKNVDAFVEKYMYEYKVFGVRLGSWRSFPLKMAWLIVAFGLIGAMASFQAIGLEEKTFRYGAFAAIYAVILVSIHILSDEKTKLDAAKNYMVEYLENVCIHRYEKANHTLKTTREQGTAEEIMESVAESAAENTEESKAKNSVKGKAEPVLECEAETMTENMEEYIKEQQDSKHHDDQEMRIRAILEEFLA